MHLFTSLFGWFRVVALLEGLSYVLLLFVCMPLKYYAGIPEAVKYTGWAHGVLFVTFVVLLMYVWINHQWSITKAACAFAASLIPFGTFVLDRYLGEEHREALAHAER